MTDQIADAQVGALIVWFDSLNVPQILVAERSCGGLVGQLRRPSRVMTARGLMSGLAFIARDVRWPLAKLDLYLHGDVRGGAAPYFSCRQMISAAKVNPDACLRVAGACVLRDAPQSSSVRPR